MNKNPSAVLFSCTWNAVRSPMAEGLLKKMLGHKVYVDSVGAKKMDVDGFAIAVMKEIDVDISNHQPKSFDDLHDTSYDLIITLSPEAQHKAMELTRTMHCDVEFWHTFDPSIVEGSRDNRLAAYRRIRHQLMQQIINRFPTDAAADLLEKV
ncbi:MAG: arsenate reductase ArsC [Rhodospirillaceae bacterium]|jgi:protein-tyrosine-phosphatase|nr:arsenate reductase ArsC [Rhodospirillales bacterium]MBT3906138.1 arsenate reductase ArsC [Rhodospirillaceae bacterium]MBT4703536.1 arsenate reductase ArsC [Rhodospirillaceae bacterium]MBT5033572.1 arsenate reductase ArsC [Rhodospirillaceae bacterium]MBT6218385.1 arsenate reductase ArsC [Rhodospirillaceae bacterium]